MTTNDRPLDDEMVEAIGLIANEQFDMQVRSHLSWKHHCLENNRIYPPEIAPKLPARQPPDPPHPTREGPRLFKEFQGVFKEVQSIFKESQSVSREVPRFFKEVQSVSNEG